MSDMFLMKNFKVIIEEPQKEVIELEVFTKNKENFKQENTPSAAVDLSGNTPNQTRIDLIKKTFETSQNDLEIDKRLQKKTKQNTSELSPKNVKQEIELKKIDESKKEKLKSNGGDLRISSNRELTSVRKYEHSYREKQEKQQKEKKNNNNSNSISKKFVYSIEFMLKLKNLKYCQKPINDFLYKDPPCAVLPKKLMKKVRESSTMKKYSTRIRGKKNSEAKTKKENFHQEIKSDTFYQIQLLMNKITPEKYVTISRQFITEVVNAYNYLVGKSRNLNDRTVGIQYLFESIVSICMNTVICYPEYCFVISKLLADLCRSTEDADTNQNIKKIIINLCQEQFKMMFPFIYTDSGCKNDFIEKNMDIFEKQMGIFFLIGGLFKEKIISSSVINIIITSFLTFIFNVEKSNIEIKVELLNNVVKKKYFLMLGKFINFFGNYLDERIEISLFQIIKEVAITEGKIPTVVKCCCDDLFELKFKRKWKKNALERYNENIPRTLKTIDIIFRNFCGKNLIENVEKKNDVRQHSQKS